jgi:hypothetical protein
MKERHAAELIQTKSSTSAEPPALASARMPADSSHRPTTSASAVDEADSISAAVKAAPAAVKAVPALPHLKEDLADASATCSSLPRPVIEERSRPCHPLSITETAKPDSTTSTPEVRFFTTGNFWH